MTALNPISPKCSSSGRNNNKAGNDATNIKIELILNPKILPHSTANSAAITTIKTAPRYPTPTPMPAIAPMF